MPADRRPNDNQPEDIMPKGLTALLASAFWLYRITLPEPMPAASHIIPFLSVTTYFLHKIGHQTLGDYTHFANACVLGLYTLKRISEELGPTSTPALTAPNQS